MSTLDFQLDDPFDFDKYPQCARGHRYALDVVRGKIRGSKYLIGACGRYLREVQDTAHPRYYFDPAKAEKFLRLAQRFEHVIGDWKTANVHLEPWQVWVCMNIMGFVSRETGYRRFRIAYLEISRGNGKSTLASIFALYFLALDNPKGNQISVVATKKDQARIVLDSARAMAMKNKSFLQATETKVLAHTIINKKSNSVVRALSSEHNGLDGLADVLAICDELHAMKRETFEVIYSGMSKRTDSLTLCITTAGENIDSVGYSESNFSKGVCLGELSDEQRFAAVYTLDEGDDVFDESNWIKSNPNWGVSVDATTFRAKAEKAKVSPNDIHNFKIKHLNMWISEMRQYYDHVRWNALADKSLRLEDFEGQKCVAAIDLASTRDLTSVAYLFRNDEGLYTYFDRSFIPQERAREVRSVQFDRSIELGELIATPGDVINNDKIREDVEAHAWRFDITECAFDPWNAREMSQKLADKLEMLEFRMNTSNLSEPTKKLDALIREGKIRHNGSSLISWCIQNVVAKEDANGNVFPRKTHEDRKIDPIIALIMALAVWLQKGEAEASVYETRGIRYL